MVWSNSNIACKKQVGDEWIDKVRHETLDEAIAAAKVMNAKLGVGAQKVTAYKCGTCHKYHIGKNGNIIKERDLRIHA